MRLLTKKEIAKWDELDGPGGGAIEQFARFCTWWHDTHPGPKATLLELVDHYWQWCLRKREVNHE